MKDIVRRLRLKGLRGDEAQHELRKQWLLTNGLGGYASGTLSGTVDWKYHGILVAALPSPFGRTVMLNHLSEHLRCPSGKIIQIGGEEPSSPEEEVITDYLVEFRLENQIPVWRYEIEGIVLEKRIVMLHEQNTTHVTYEALAAPSEVGLQLRPSVHFRGYEAPVHTPITEDYTLRMRGQKYELMGDHDLPPLRLYLHAAHRTFTYDGGSRREIFYRHDAERGYEARGELWSPGYFNATLHKGQRATLIASTEEWKTVMAVRPEEALSSDRERSQRLISMAPEPLRTGVGAELVLAADQFIIKPAGRVEDAARARAAGEEIRTVIAGYHWFTDWGRDTMISLEGLTLCTGRHTEARWILRTFAHYVRDGLIPNFFPDGQNEGLYHTADATLWFFHALHRYLDVTGDRATLETILPRLLDIYEAHRHGTKYGIHVDPKDGLLAQGAPGYQLTWMDAKVGDWVVTPRRGKAVEINALWYNALCLLEKWAREAGNGAKAEEIREQSERARTCFNQRFWFEEGGYLYDVIDGENGADPACRPNQIFAVSLPHPILEPSRWEAVVNTVKERHVTPVGLRSLSREHPDYKPKYFGDLRARDAAYHQGTVWGWLIGPFIDAWLRVHPEDTARAREWLAGLPRHLSDACVGSINEVFDADPPYAPRGCVAQAWSVAEALRCWLKTAPP